MVFGMILNMRGRNMGLIHGTACPALNFFFLNQFMTAWDPVASVTE